jgi:predicted amidophosphoribosyltransferase
MYCQHCHAEISPSHTSCPVCKQPVKAVHSSCPNCSADMGPDIVCCSNCGYHLLLKKVIKLHDIAGAPSPQTTIICPACKKEIPMASRFCEYCGSDVKTSAKPSLAAASSQDVSQSSAAAGQSTVKNCVGFNEATFIALIKMLEKKGVISLEDLQDRLGK